MCIYIVCMYFIHRCNMKTSTLSSNSTKQYNREHRPVHALYVPVYAYRFWNSIRSWSMMYLYDANPGMPPVRFLQFSKWHILKQIDSQYVPKTFVIKAHQALNEKKLTDFIKQQCSYPVITKPDIGERWSDVQVIYNQEDLLEQIYSHPTEDFLVQEFIDEPLEMWIMYYRYPEKNTGVISGITLKEFFTVTGNGKDDLLQLIIDHPRGEYYRELFEEAHKDILNIILPKGEMKQLNQIGNHCKGTKFLDGSYLINEQLTILFDTIAKSIKWFYYGRFDIKVSSIEDLYAGKNIKILEVNGIQSEPAHIYDPNTSLLDGYKELFKHWKVMYQISKTNRKMSHQRNIWRFWQHLTDQIQRSKEKNNIS